MILSKRMFKHISALMVMNGRVGLEVATKWAEEVAQLDAELEVLKDLDVSGLKIIATELAKTEPPYKWSSIWRDCGIRQSTIGKQLLRLCDKLEGKS